MDMILGMKENILLIIGACHGSSGFDPFLMFSPFWNKKEKEVKSVCFSNPFWDWFAVSTYVLNIKTINHFKSYLPMSLSMYVHIHQHINTHTYTCVHIHSHVYSHTLSLRFPFDVIREIQRQLFCLSAKDKSIHSF